jgi:hypothetical protein
MDIKWGKRIKTEYRNQDAASVSMRHLLYVAFIIKVDYILFLLDSVVPRGWDPHLMVFRKI